MRYISLACTLFLVPGLVLAQKIDTIEDDDWCKRSKHDSYDGYRLCEVREFSVSDLDELEVEGGPNGGIAVEGWGREHVLVRARVTAHARTQERAADIMEDITVGIQDSEVRADGPRTGRKSWYSVSWHVYTPYEIDLDLDAHNGGISIFDVEGDIRFETVNGGVDLDGLAGDVKGETTNGGVNVRLTGDSWDGAGLDVETTNGGVTIIVPEGYNAELESRTTNGGIHVDFPIMVQGKIDRRLRTTLGAGGPTIRAETTNGGVHLERG
jgi:hypothetical protein